MMFWPTGSTTALNREDFLQYPCHFGAAFEQVVLFGFQLVVAWRCAYGGIVRRDLCRTRSKLQEKKLADV